MLWVMTTADKYEFPLCVERTAGELARKTGLSEGAVRSIAYRGRKLRQPGMGQKKASFRIYQVEE